MQHTNWTTINKEVLNEKAARQVVNGENITVGKMFLAKDCVVPVHHHVSEQISLLMEGSATFELEGKIITAHAGDVVVIPPNVPHRVVALEDTLAYDVFSPIRQDWIDGTDSYLRK